MVSGISWTNNECTSGRLVSVKCEDGKRPVLAYYVVEILHTFAATAQLKSKAKYFFKELTAMVTVEFHSYILLWIFIHW